MSRQIRRFLCYHRVTPIGTASELYSAVIFYPSTFNGAPADLFATDIPRECQEHYDQGFRQPIRDIQQELAFARHRIPNISDLINAAQKRLLNVPLRIFIQ